MVSQYHFFYNYISVSFCVKIGTGVDEDVERVRRAHQNDIGKLQFKLLNIFIFKYRVSHETWQLVNSFECRLPYTVLDSKGFMQFISVKKSFAQIYFRINFSITWLLYNISIIVFGIKQSNKIMEEDILNYLPTFMFRGTPSTKISDMTYILCLSACWN